MTASKSPEMVGNCLQIVNVILHNFFGELIHVHILLWNLYRAIILFPAIILLFESLDVDDQNGRRGLDLHCFERLRVLFALVTVPHVRLVQLLSFGESFNTI